jgi:predicted nucleotide-binding protein
MNTYFHVRITQKSKPTRDETKVDLSKEQLFLRFLEPYEKGEPIIINGKTILPNDLERIRISKSNVVSTDIINKLKYQDSNSSVFVVGGPSYEWRAANEFDDVTDEFINGPVGYKKDTYKKNKSEKVIKISNKDVFIVHGHDDSIKNEIESFIRDLQLNPIILHKKADEGLTIIEKFEKHSNVSFAIILLTPDDIGFAKNELKKDTKLDEMRLRARQNVIFEFGFFVAKLGRSNVCCIYKESVELPSDINGLLYKKYNESIEEIGYSLIKELQKAGLKPEIKY